MLRWSRRGIKRWGEGSSSELCNPECIIHHCWETPKEAFLDSFVVRKHHEELLSKICFNWDWFLPKNMLMSSSLHSPLLFGKVLFFGCTLYSRGGFIIFSYLSTLHFGAFFKLSHFVLWDFFSPPTQLQATPNGAFLLKRTNYYYSAKFIMCVLNEAAIFILMPHTLGSVLMISC